METREKTFNLRFTLTADIPDALLEDDDFDEDGWLKEWEAGIKPDLVRTIFTQLRRFAHGEAHVRNRGVSSVDEIEVVLRRAFPLASAPPDRTTS
jgi:hypothetical protein